MDHLKIGRSHSLDERENIFHQMMMQKEAKEFKRAHESSPLSVISHLRKRSRKGGLGLSENQKILNSIIKDQLSCSEKSDQNFDQRNRKNSSSSLNFNVERFPFCLVNYQNLHSDDSFALSERDLDQGKENLKFADDDDEDSQERNHLVNNCNTSDQYNNEDVNSTLFEEQESYCLHPDKPLNNTHFSKPSIVIDSSLSSYTDTEESKLSNDNSETFDSYSEKSNSENFTFKKWGGRKSEPTFPCTKKTSNYLAPPNLEIRRHTLPNSANKTLQNQGMANFSPIFNTSSWETLPPEEEMEIMEDKPIEIKDDLKEIDQRNTSTPKSAIVKDILDSFTLSANNCDVIGESYKELEENLNEDSYWDVKFAPIFPDFFYNNNNIKFPKEEINTQASYCDGTPKIIKLHPKKVKNNYDESSNSNKIFDKSNCFTSRTFDMIPYKVSDVSEWQEVRLLNKSDLNGEGNLTPENYEENGRKFPEDLNSFRDSVTHSISSEDSDNELFSQGLYNICNDSNRTYNSSSPLISSEEETSSENDVFEGGDKLLETNGDFKRKDSLTQDEQYFYKAFEGFNNMEDEEKAKRRSFIKKTFSDPEIFTRNKKGNIPISRDTYSAVYNVATHMVGTVLSDASTQTSFTSTPIRCSPTLSFAWLPEGYDDSASLEPCASSLVFSFSDDEEDAKEEDEQSDWWMTEESLSSLSSEIVDDNYSLALSESLDNLDQNIESGIGTVSTRPSHSPFINNDAFDFSCSNLSSEDTGLEISYDRRSKIMIPSTSYYNDAYLPFFKKENWIRLENQSTQTDPEQREKCLLLIEKSKINKILKEHMKADDQEIGSILSETDILKYNLKKLKGIVNIEDISPYPLERPGLRNSFNRSLENIFCPNKEGSLKPRNKLKLRNDFQHTTKTNPLPSSLQCKQTNTPSKGNFYDFIKNEQEIGNRIIEKRNLLKEISEIEATEACKWLRAAGFPQYAQMYDDYQFPLDLSSVERDHTFLDADSLQALFRRLRVLNRCAKIRLDSSDKKSNVEDSEDDEQECALSGNWTFEKQSRRWSRIDPSQFPLHGRGDLRPCDSNLNNEPEEYSREQFKRSGSERLKDGAKAFLRRMESIKNKKKKRHREGIVISSPEVLDENLMKARISELGCVSLSSDEASQVQLSSGTNIYHRNSYDHSDTRMDSNYLGDIRIVKSEDSSSLASDQSQSSTPMFRSRRRKRFWRRGFSGDVVGTTFAGDDAPNVGGMSCAYSDSECSPKTWRHRFSNSGPSKFEVLTQCREALKENKKPGLRHVSSLTYGRESHKKRDDYISSKNKVIRKSMDETSTTRPSEFRQNSEARLSIYDNVPIVICNKSYFDYHSDSTATDARTQEGFYSSECTMESRESPLPSTNEETEERQSKRGTVERWHSFNRKSSSVSSFQRSGNQIYGLSVGQMNHVRKRALLRLTALMERHCPSHRSSWNWELPKFIKKIKSPDYKDKAVFGIPLQVINQRTGYPLPVGIQRALTHLKTHCIDQVGLFRKPGVRSRIQNLRDLHETESDIYYFDFGAFDIADMVKTYFRELPEVLLTNKLSEIFIIICQYLPVSVRLEALQCVMLMMPDENREVLMYLLYFLSDMAANSHLNQMTESNLAVCMAPSLFFLNMGSSSSSPLRKKTLGTPEQKDLHDNKAAHQCLTLMIQEVNQLQCLPGEMLSNCRFSFLDLSQPVSLEDLGSASNVSYTCNDGETYWIAYMRACIDSLLRESKDKARGWMHINYPDPLVEVCYRKVGDGHPLRLWKVTTDVEAPPTELLNRVLRERHLWDDTLLKWRVVKRLNKEAEVFQYMCNSMSPRPPLDYCVLRCWKTDLGKGLCVIVETSVEHTDAPPLPDSTRGIVLASRYLIQPCGSGKSRITNISRIDMRGRLPEWYNKNYAFFTANHISRLRQSFQHFACGPESKV